jgi:hypothetical protein
MRWASCHRPVGLWMVQVERWELTVRPLIEPAANGSGIEWAGHPEGTRPRSATVGLVKAGWVGVHPGTSTR